MVECSEGWAECGDLYTDNVVKNGSVVAKDGLGEVKDGLDEVKDGLD